MFVQKETSCCFEDPWMLAETQTYTCISPNDSAGRKYAACAQELRRPGGQNERRGAPSRAPKRPQGRKSAACAQKSRTAGGPRGRQGDTGPPSPQHSDKSCKTGQTAVEWRPRQASSPHWGDNNGPQPGCPQSYNNK